MQRPPRACREVLRRHLGHTGTKSGCDAGDCGACTVLIDGEPACACLVPAAQAEGASIVTIEGLARNTAKGEALQKAFLARGAAQCGICTPGMLVAAAALLEREAAPTPRDDCRCAGRRPLPLHGLCQDHRCGGGCRARAGSLPRQSPEQGHAVGARHRAARRRAEGQRHGALRRRCRSARCAVGQGRPLAPSPRRLPLRRSCSLCRRPSRHRPYTDGGRHSRPQRLRRDPALRRPARLRRGRGALPRRGRRGDRGRARGGRGARPLGLPRHLGGAAARARHRGGARCRQRRSSTTTARAMCWSRAAWCGAMSRRRCPRRPSPSRAVRDRPSSSTPISSPRPAGPGAWATGSRSPPPPRRPTWTATTRRPSWGLPPEAIRIIPSACGGGFGSKLDLSVQPYIALAAWVTGRPAAMVYTRPESIQSTTKRHPAVMRSRMAATREGDLLAMDFDGGFQHRRLCLLGPDGGEPRAGPCLGPLSGAELPGADPRGPHPLRARRAPSAASACRRR